MAYTQEDIEEHAPKITLWDWKQCTHIYICRMGHHNDNQIFRCMVCGMAWVWDTELGCYVQRGTTWKNSSKESCPQGHEYSTENTRIYRGKRYCKVCQKERDKTRKNRESLSKRYPQTEVQAVPSFEDLEGHPV